MPEGYFNPGPWVIDDGDGTVAPDEYGELMFWADIDRVDADPCKPGGTADVGPTVRNLADALAAQKNRTTTRPVTVTLHGNKGIYVESRGSKTPPAAAEMVSRPCGTRTPTGRTRSASIRQHPADVDPGRERPARGGPGQHLSRQTANPAEMAEIAQSVRFTDLP